VFVVFGASDWRTTAWLDGQKLGDHQGGYTPFSFELKNPRLGARPISDNDLVRATILDSNLNPLQVGLGALVPRRNTNLGPRFDYAINDRNTLIARYNFFESKTKNNGIGNFTLPQRGYQFQSKNHNIQRVFRVFCGDQLTKGHGDFLGRGDPVFAIQDHAVTCIE